MNPRELYGPCKTEKRVHNWFILLDIGNNILCCCDTEENVKRFIKDREALKQDRGPIKVYQLLGTFNPSTHVDYKFNKV